MTSTIAHCEFQFTHAPPRQLLRCFFDWFRELGEPGRPWLILGKGPSFAERTKFDLTEYRLLSLNHVVREQPVLAAHVIDFDVVRACEDILERHARVLVMPWYPHIHNRVGRQSLAELVTTVPVLARFAEEGRLLWYDLSTSPKRHGAGPVVRATYFSAEAALSLLASAGVRRIRTLGIDGGAAYSAQFDDLRGQTLLANGHASFDLQFKGFARTLLESGVDFFPLNMPSPAQVCVAYPPTEMLAAEVLRHSIHRNASLTVDVALLPASCENEAEGAARAGGAIVLSPRVQCFADIRQLWAAIARAREPRAPSAERSRPAERAGLPSAWQPTRCYVPERTRLLEYAGDGSEPWLSRAHPLGYLWVRDLLDGVRRGRISVDLIAEEVRRGHVRPSLAYQVAHGVEEPLLLPRRARALDRGFLGPGGLRVRPVHPVTDSMAVLEALGRYAYRWVHAVRADLSDAARAYPLRRQAVVR